jgi:hypothetical protein
MAGSDGRNLTNRIVVHRPFKPGKWPDLAALSAPVLWVDNCKARG